MANILIILGSNLKDKNFYLAKAVDLLSYQFGKPIKTSSIYVSPPWGYESNNEYYNQLVIFSCSESPMNVLIKCLLIENCLGRKRELEGYADRTIDIDILAIDNLIESSNDLTLPHPRLQERKFCLLPMNEVCSDWMHPILGKSIQELINECPDKSELKII